MAHNLKLIVVNVLVALVLLFAADRLLAVLGLPSDIPLRSAHRANVTKILKSLEFEYEFSTNDLGLRYPQIPLEKSPGEVRILLLGDSFTEGVGVQSSDTFGTDLESHYSSKLGNEVRFINAGLGGKGPVQYWRVFRDVGLKLDPDGLLICLYANDLMDTPESLSREDLYRRHPERYGVDKLVHSLLPRIYTIVGEAKRVLVREIRQYMGFVATVTKLAREHGIKEDAIQHWSKTLPKELVEASDRNEFNKALLSIGLFHPNFWAESLDINTPRAEQKYQALNIVLNEITGVARENGMAIGLIYIPVPLQYDQSRHESWNPWIIGGVNVREQWTRDVSEIQKRLADLARAKSIPFLDMTSVLRAEIKRGRVLNFKLDGHWNAEGHRVASKAIAEWIEESDVFPALLREGVAN